VKHFLGGWFSAENLRLVLSKRRGELSGLRLAVTFGATYLRLRGKHETTSFSVLLAAAFWTAAVFDAWIFQFGSFKATGGIERVALSCYFWRDVLDAWLLSFPWPQPNE
jgi:hypothetical protein